MVRQCAPFTFHRNIPHVEGKMLVPQLILAPFQRLPLKKKCSFTATVTSLVDSIHPRNDGMKMALALCGLPPQNT